MCSRKIHIFIHKTENVYYEFIFLIGVTHWVLLIFQFMNMSIKILILLLKKIFKIVEAWLVEGAPCVMSGFPSNFFF